MAKSSSGSRRRLGRGLASLIEQPVRVDEGSTELDPASGSAALPTLSEPSSSKDAAESRSASGDSRDTPDVSMSSSTDGPTDALRSVPIDLIDPGRYQPRRLFHEEHIDALASSILRSGVMQPVLLRPMGDRFELVAGERRWRAAQQVGLESIPAIIRDLDDLEAAEAGIVENVQRSDLNPLERAHAYAQLISEFGLTQGDVAERVGIDRSSVSNLIRLLDLSEDVQARIIDETLTLGHAKVLLSIDDHNRRSALAARCGKEQWSVRRLELESKQNTIKQEGPASSGLPDQRSATVKDLESRLSDFLGTRVAIRLGRSGTKGRFEVAFYSLDHFDGLMQRIGLPEEISPENQG